MNEDLLAIEKEIEKRSALPVEKPPTVPEIPFAKLEEKSGKDKATELVENAFSQAIVTQVVENQEIQKELLESADTVIGNKLNAIKARADQEDKEANFNNKKGACECFGYNEATTEKWAVNMMNFWHNIATFIWIVIGFFTFAPITFVAKKIAVIFKQMWVAVTLAIIIYLIAVASPFVINFLTSNGYL